MDVGHGYEERGCGGHGERAYEGGRHGHNEHGCAGCGGHVQVDGHGQEHGWQQPVNINRQ